SSTPPSGAVVPYAIGYLILLIVAACLVFPSQRIYNYANYLLQPATNISFGGGGGPSSTPPSGAVVPYAIGYLILLIVAACLVFRKKDL
ncbi:MAG TPA: hypothetical protein VIC60_03515, partial [Thermomicrobiales bacterium]